MYGKNKVCLAKIKFAREKKKGLYGKNKWCMAQNKVCMRYTCLLSDMYNHCGYDFTIYWALLPVLKAFKTKATDVIVYYLFRERVNNRLQKSHFPLKCSRCSKIFTFAYRRAFHRQLFLEHVLSIFNPVGRKTEQKES